MELCSNGSKSFRLCNEVDTGYLYLKASSWLNGPQQLFESTPQKGETHELVMPNDDIEIRTAFTTVDPTKVNSSCSGLGTARFERYSSWKSLIAGINHLRLIAHQRKSGKSADFKAVIPKVGENVPLGALGLYKGAV